LLVKLEWESDTGVHSQSTIKKAQPPKQ
jgi:hypothetical protein